MTSESREIQQGEALLERSPDETRFQEAFAPTAGYDNEHAMG